jgi:MFS transporter, FHS family, glucose/mannose:H+ symporter
MNYWLVGIAYLSLLALGIGDNIRGPLYPEILTEMSLSDTVGGWFFSLSSIVSFSGSLLLRNRFVAVGPIRVLRFGLGLMAAALYAFGSSGSFGFLLLAASFFGLSSGIMGLCQNYLVTVGAAGPRLQQVMSGLHSMYGMASFAAPLFVTSLYAKGLLWREVFCWAALFPLAVMIASFAIKEVKVPVQEEIMEKDQAKSRFGLELYFAVLLAVYVATEILISTRLSLFMRRVQNEEMNQANLYLTWFFVFLLAGRLLFSFIRPKTHLSSQLKLSLIGTIFCLLLGLTVNPFFLAVSGLAMAPFYPMAMAYASHIFRKVEMASVIGLCLAMSSMAIVMMNIIVGQLSDSFGIDIAMYFGVVTAVASYFLILMLPKVQKKWS